MGDQAVVALPSTTSHGALSGAGARSTAELPLPAQPSPFASVARGAIALLSAQPFLWAASLLTGVLLPRLLGSQGFGEYSVVFNIALLACTIATVGVPGYLVRHVATCPDRVQVDVGAALILLLGLAALVASGLIVILPLLGLQTSEAGLLPSALIWIIAMAAQRVLYSALVGQERHSRVAWFGAVNGLLGPGLGIGLLLVGGGVTGYVAALAATATFVTGFTWCSAGFRLHRGVFDPQIWRQLLVGGLPFLGWNVAISVRNQIDIILVGLLLQEQAAGWLAAAYKVTSVPFFVPNLINIPLNPALSRSAADRPLFRETLRRSVVIVLTLMVPCSATIIALAPIIPDLLGWGAAFHNSVPLIMILAIEQPLAALDILLGTALFALKQERRWLRVAVAAAAFNSLANVLLLQLFERWLQNGAIGAAVVEVATEGVMLIGALILLPRGMVDLSLAWIVMRLVLASAGLALVAMAISPLSVPLAVIAGGVTFLATAGLLGVLRLAELRAIRDVALTTLARRRGTEP